MQTRQLGKTGLEVSTLAFGAGPVSGLMTAGADTQRQFETVRRAVEMGINWFDTAATYSGGESERSLGKALLRLGAPSHVHVATKVRLDERGLQDIPGLVRQSVEESLARLQLPRVTLLQLHNAVTARRNDEPTSITPLDVLGQGGVLEAFDRLRDEGLVSHFGLTGTGQPTAMREVVSSGRFAAIQVPYHLLNPSAAAIMPEGFCETNYGGIINTCAALGMGVMAIRVFAGGALAGQPPSAHTLTTKFFPLDLYERDLARASQLAAALPGGLSLKEAALRFVLSNNRVSSAIVGFGSADQVNEAVRCAEAGPLPLEISDLRSLALKSGIQI